jgi:hypothetical protein
MKCVQTFKTRESANRSVQQLREGGIEARVVVDPLESRMPALSDFCDVSLMVAEKDEHKARGILGGAPAKTLRAS